MVDVGNLLTPPATAVYSAGGAVLADYHCLSLAIGDWHVNGPTPASRAYDRSVAKGDGDWVRSGGSSALLGALEERAKADLSVALAGAIAQDLLGVEAGPTSSWQRADEEWISQVMDELRLAEPQAKNFRQSVETEVRNILGGEDVRLSFRAATGAIAFGWVRSGSDLINLFDELQSTRASSIEWKDEKFVARFNADDVWWEVECVECGEVWTPHVLKPVSDRFRGAIGVGCSPGRFGCPCEHHFAPVDRERKP